MLALLHENLENQFNNLREAKILKGIFNRTRWCFSQLTLRISM